MKSADEIKKFFKNAAINTNPKMDEAVLNKVLIAHEKTTNTKSAAVEPNIRRKIMKNPATKLAAMITLICMGVAAAAVVGVKIKKYYFVGRESDGTYVFKTESETTRSTADPNTTIDVDQKIRELEEIDLLRQNGDRELVSVVEKEVNGKLCDRTFMFKYVLSDGREITRGDTDPEYMDVLTEVQQDELISLMRADKEEEINFREKEVDGRMFSFECHRFILNDGTDVIWSRGTPK